ncbi:HEAT repeat domain-containing protein [Vibrio comitans]|uniref:Uncharacterized protein n=1 Tax=Vibrio comitans NBRC 102076 TaxID=1219078 RepID=A0A4Y3IPZ2_9VIBR|nr:HEAT repeat domain-containing protein [Vibrio comitans]GEA61145.1 hypothetical protein VCO01S_23380 [Vibrio comitans NBRC 102076]
MWGTNLLRLCVVGLTFILPMQTAYSSSLDDQEMSLARLSQNESIDLATRTEATRLLGQFSGPNALIAIGRASRHHEPLMRLAAIQAAAQWNGPARWDLVSPLLDDSDELVNSTAVMVLIPQWSQMTKVYRDKLFPFAERYLSNLPDDLEGQLIAAWAEQNMGDIDAAESRLNKLYQQGKDVRVVLGYSKVLLANHKPKKAQLLLEDNLDHVDDSATLYHQLGNVLLINGELEASSHAYQMAYQLDPSIDHYALDYALSIQNDHPQVSINIFEKLYAESKSPQYLYAECEVMLVQNLPAKECLAELSRVTSQQVANELLEKTQSQLKKD